MKTQLKLEEGAMLILGVTLFSLLDYPWWLFPTLLLIPDLSMAGYMVNNDMGAMIYNFFHHKGLAVLISMIGFFINAPVVQLVGIILFSHSCLDRMLGYGLKYPDSFRHTHLGWIGNKQNKESLVK